MVSGLRFFSSFTSMCRLFFIVLHQNMLRSSFWGAVWVDFILIYLCFLILDYFYDNEDRTDEEAEPTFSEDEALTQRGVRRSQSVKITRSRVRKDVRLLFLPSTFGVFLYCIKTHLFCPQTRYGSLKIKGKKRPALGSVNYGM